ncbi:MAG TPA: hypothetical protein VFC29_23235, partial [Candidatus Limnocylindrales bacterium]|nr:hypothetical protein [Candidatus Limnocylindrales bacterium]
QSFGVLNANLQVEKDKLRSMMSLRCNPRIVFFHLFGCRCSIVQGGVIRRSIAFPRLRLHLAWTEKGMYALGLVITMENLNFLQVFDVL